MLALIIVLMGAALQEVGVSIGKAEVSSRKEGIYSLGFLSVFWGLLAVVAAGFLLPGGWRLDIASLPTLAVRGFLEIFQAYVTVRAIAMADRSTNGFIRVMTIPLLLLADAVLGYRLELRQVWGMGVIAVSLMLLSLNGGFRRKGAFWALLSAVNAVLTISIYKYHITHFNSVAAEQTIFLVLLIVYFLVMAKRKEGVNPMRMLVKWPFCVQAFSCGLGTALVSYAYPFAPASVVTTGKRVFEVLGATVSGRVYFHEKKLFLKLTAFVVVAVGLYLLA